MANLNRKYLTSCRWDTARSMIQSPEAYLAHTSRLVVFMPRWPRAAVEFHLQQGTHGVFGAQG